MVTLDVPVFHVFLAAERVSYGALVFLKHPLPLVEKDPSILGSGEASKCRKSRDDKSQRVFLKRLGLRFTKGQIR